MKKAQIFMLDFILSIVVLIIALVTVFSYFGSTTPNTDIYELNNEIMNAFTTTKINSLNDEDIRRYFIAQKIKNVENTVAQQVGEFYFINQTSDAQDLTRDFMHIYISNEINIDVLIGNSSNRTLIYNRNNVGSSFPRSELSSTTNRLVLGFNNGSFYSYEFSIILWQ